MFLVSTPSLTVSLVLAVFYLANLAFYAINRQQDVGDATITVSVADESERCPLPAVWLQAEDHTSKYTIPDNCCFAQACLPKYLATIVARDNFRHALPCLNPSIFDPGICWILFGRPPPSIMS